MARPLICLFRSHLVTLFVARRRPLAGRWRDLGAAVREATRPGVGIEGAHTLFVTLAPPTAGQ
jgi:hypothetical protein